MVLSKAVADNLYNQNRRQLLALDKEALKNDERLAPCLDQKIPLRDAYKLRHTRASELISSGAAKEGPGELGHSPLMFFTTYAKQIEAYEDTKKDKSKLDSLVHIS